ncbi:MAG: type II secretion system protein GspG [Leptospirales bacterium]
MKIKNLSRRRGITLIEMMVVIAIISVLMTIIYVNVGTVGDDATTELHKKASKIKIEGALFRYQSEYRTYPTTHEGFEVLLNPPALEDGRVPRSYLQESEISDPWNNPYVYENMDGSYKVYSLGADNQPGGEGKNADFNLTNQN